jgi:ferrous iron transport protein A
MTLDNAKRGQSIEIINISDLNVKAQAIRFGIFEGAKLICSEKLPKGPVILQNKTQEIAVGRNLACKIRVNPV